MVACGRRFGKTETGKLLLIDAALYRHKTCWWLAPTYQMASDVWRDLKALLRNVPQQVSEAERRLTLPGGGSISIRSTHAPDNLRGAGLDFAVLDEAAYMDPTVWTQVVRPMLLERRGSAVFLSTPFGKNHFWDLYRLGLDPEEPEWVSFHFTSQDNPLIAPQELAAIRRQTPDYVWRTEYLAEFSENSGQVFRAVRAAATAPLLAQPRPGSLIVGGLDWGREDDYTVLALVDADTRQMVALERFRGMRWSAQRDRIAAACARWQPAVIWAESNSIGAPNIEALQAEGLPLRPFVTSASSKPPLIERLALALERGELALLPDEVLLSELASYQLERLPGGGYRYSAPPGTHDDTVIALALAWHAVLYGGVGMAFV